MASNNWGEIFSALMQRGLLIKREQRERLMSMANPFQVISSAEELGIGKGMLSDEDLNKMEEFVVKVPQNGSNKSSIGARTIAPINETPISAPALRNMTPDWRQEDFPMAASDCNMDITVHFDITGNSVTEGKMSDINACFADRLSRIRKMIIRNSRLPRSPSEISRLLSQKTTFTGMDQIAVAIGLVNNPRHTKNGHLMFDLEDESGEMACLLTKGRSDDRNIAHEAVIEAGLMPDDVVGVSGTFSQKGDIFYVDDLHFPMADRREKVHAEQGVSVAFLSDIHVGSRTFLEAQWHKMMQWFSTDPLARTIKYLILSGDCVDGVGIYPGQDKELAIKDLFAQYSRFAELLELLPEWVECIMLPGNHDAVRPAEPQPTLEPEIQQDYNATTFVGNPCDFSLHGVRLLSYHGKSIDDFVAGLKTVTYENPVEAMRQMLRRRHLAPQWGGKTPLSPEPEDGLVIDVVPDIFVTGHVHGHACIDFRGTTLVCSSTWQDQTSYQRMLGFQPKPCMLTIVNLGTHKTISIPFA